MCVRPHRFTLSFLYIVIQFLIMSNNFIFVICLHLITIHKGIIMGIPMYIGFSVTCIFLIFLDGKICFDVS